MVPGISDLLFLSDFHIFESIGKNLFEKRSCHLHFDLLSWPSPSGFPTKSLHTPLLSPHTCYMPRPSQYWFHHPHNIWWAVQIRKLLVMQSSLIPCYLVRLRPNYLPQHPILKHPQPTFIQQCQTPSFTPIQNSRQSYSSACLHFRVANMSATYGRWNTAELITTITTAHVKCISIAFRRSLRSKRRSGVWIRKTN